jgi:hypothetical protein
VVGPYKLKEADEKGTGGEEDAQSTASVRQKGEAHTQKQDKDSSKEADKA